MHEIHAPASPLPVRGLRPYVISGLTLVKESYGGPDESGSGVGAEGGGGGGGVPINIYDPINWCPNSPFTPGVELLRGDITGKQIMRMPGGGWMRSDDPGVVWVLGKDGSRTGMNTDSYMDKYEFTGDGVSGEHNQRVRDNRGEISDNPSAVEIANVPSAPRSSMPVGGQSAATCHYGTRTWPSAQADAIEPDFFQLDDAVLILKGLVKIGISAGIAAIVAKTAGKEVAGIAGKEGTEVEGKAAARESGAFFKTTKEAVEAAKRLGFERINATSKGQAVFTNGKMFITRDVDGHTGGAWKVARSVEDLASKATRSGTYDENLIRIGD